MKKVLINHILQQYRKETFLSLVEDNIIEDIEIENDDISIEYLMKIIQELPDRYRLVFNLNVIDGYSHQEIASMLKINIGTSKSNLHRARMILKIKIEGNTDNFKILWEVNKKKRFTILSSKYFKPKSRDDCLNSQSLLAGKTDRNL